MASREYHAALDVVGSRGQWATTPRARLPETGMPVGRRGASRPYTPYGTAKATAMARCYGDTHTTLSLFGRAYDYEGTDG